MTVEHFETFVKECQRIRGALDLLPDFCIDGVFAAWEAGGIFSPDWGSQNHDPQFTQQHITRWWVNVAAHMSVAAVLGYKIATHTRYQRPQDIAEALLIHDWNKRQEVSHIKRGYDCGKIHAGCIRSNEKLLRWFSKQVVTLANAAGHGGIAITESRPLTLGEQVVFYADMCVSGSMVTPYNWRLDELQSRMQPGGIYEDSERYFQRQYKKSYREKHEEALVPIEAAFAKQIEFTGPQENLPLFLAPKEFQAA